MYSTILKTATNASVADYIAALTEDEIQEFCGITIFRRGKDYENHAIEEIEYVHENKIEAEVTGSELYDVVIEKKDSKIVATCSCPFEGEMCKHTVAVLLFAIKRKNKSCKIPEMKDLQKQKDSKEQIFHRHLESLSNEELMKLVKKFAPQSFIDQIFFSNSSESSAIENFTLIKKKIDKLLNGVDYGETDIEAKLLSSFKLLQSFWKVIPEKVAELIADTIQKIEEMSDEGYFYNDYNDEFCDFSAISDNIAEFLASLPTNLKIKYFDKLLEINASSETFSFARRINDIFNDNDVPALKQHFIESVKTNSEANPIEKYSKLKDTLNATEKELIFKTYYQNMSFFIIPYIEFLVEQQQEQQAFTICVNKKDSFINTSGWSTAPDSVLFFSLFIKITKLLNKPLPEALTTAMMYNPTAEMLKIVIAELPQEKQHFENIFEHKNLTGYFSFLENEERLQEALKILKSGKIGKGYTYNFMKRNKKTFPEDAEAVFCEKIVDELKHTGDSHYAEIADALNQIKVINPQKATLLAKQIRTEYSRRRNLMRLIAVV